MTTSTEIGVRAS